MRPGFSGEAVRTAEQPLLEQGRGPALMAVAAHGLQLHCRRLLRTRRGRVAGSRAVVLAGKGNNGGDGLW
ncbi:NAD(P)H-hydrate epimerase, partial [Kocuria palustris]